MIDDLTLKARIMALDPDNIQKNPLMGMRTGDTWSQRNLPTWTPKIGANAKVGKDYAKTQNRDFATLNEQQKKENKELDQQQNRTQHQQNAALRGNPVLPEKYQRTGADGQQQKPETMLAAADKNAQEIQMGLGSNGTPNPDNSETKVKTTNGPDGTSKVEQITTHSNDEVPENTEQGGGNPEGGDVDNTQNSQPVQQASPAVPPLGSPAQPMGAPATPATIPLPAGSPATPPPPPNMAAPLPTQQPTTMTGGDTNSLGGGQQMNPVFNIGAGGQGQQQQGQAAPQNDPKQNAKNMQVANATARANTKGGIGTGVMSNLLTGGLAGAARLGFNAYQRGQGKKELAELAKSPYSKVLSVFEIRKGISARNTTEVLRRGRI